MKYYNELLEEDLEHILKHTNDIWDNFEDKTIFITGGTGFFGKWFLETFAYAKQKLDLNCKIIVLSRNPEKYLDEFIYMKVNPIFKFIKGDVRDFVFPEESIDYIIHAATSGSVELNNTSPLLVLDTIINGTRRTFELAKEKKVKSFLLTSSGAVYGKFYSDILKVSEDYKGSPNCTDPLSAYAEGKRIAELLCSIYYQHFGVPAKIARCFAFVGPYLPIDKHFAIGNFIKDVLENKPIVVKGDGTPYRSYLYPTDLVTWLLRILLKGKNSYPYNVGSSKEITIAELADQIALLSSPSVKVQIKSQSKESNYQESYVPVNERIIHELNANQNVELEQAITKTINYFKKV